MVFSVSPSAGSPLVSYNWNNGSGTDNVFTLTAVKQEYIILSATNESNCISEDSVLLNIKNCDSTADNCIHFPNAFTPNGDGKNDLFGALANCPVSGYQLKIFNRYGQLVFESTDVSKKWDGNFNGAIQDSGNYVFTCEYSLGAVKKIKNGFVILLR